MAQTAVGLLIKELRQLAHNTNHHLGLGDIRITQGMIDDFEEKYNQMEKMQIMDAWIGTNNCDSAEEYYNKTYGK